MTDKLTKVFVDGEYLKAEHLNPIHVAVNSVIDDASTAQSTASNAQSLASSAQTVASGAVTAVSTLQIGLETTNINLSVLEQTVANLSVGGEPGASTSDQLTLSSPSTEAVSSITTQRQLNEQNISKFTAINQQLNLLGGGGDLSGLVTQTELAEFALDFNVDQISGIPDASMFVNPELYWVSRNEVTVDLQSPPSYTVTHTPTESAPYLEIQRNTNSRLGNAAFNPIMPYTNVSALGVRFPGLSGIRKATFQNLAGRQTPHLIVLPYANGTRWASLAFRLCIISASILRWHDAGTVDGVGLSAEGDAVVPQITGGRFTTVQQMVTHMYDIGIATGNTVPRAESSTTSYTVELIDDPVLAPRLGFYFRLWNIAETDYLDIFADIMTQGAYAPRTVGLTTPMADNDVAAMIVNMNKEIIIAGDQFYVSAYTGTFTFRYYGDWKKIAPVGNTITNVPEVNSLKNLYGNNEQAPGIFVIKRNDLWRDAFQGIGLLVHGASTLSGSVTPNPSTDGFTQKAAAFLGMHITNNAVGGSAFRAYRRNDNAWLNRVFRQGIPVGFNGVSIVGANNDIIGYLRGTYDGTTWVEGLDDLTFLARLGDPYVTIAAGTSTWNTDGDSSTTIASGVGSYATNTTLCTAFASCLYRLTSLNPRKAIIFIPIFTHHNYDRKRRDCINDALKVLARWFGCLLLDDLEARAGLPTPWTSPGSVFSQWVPDSLHFELPGHTRLAGALIDFMLENKNAIFAGD